MDSGAINDILLAIIAHEEEHEQISDRSSRSGRSLRKRFDSDYFYFQCVSLSKYIGQRIQRIVFLVCYRKILSSNVVNIKLQIIHK